MTEENVMPQEQEIVEQTEVVEETPVQNERLQEKNFRELREKNERLQRENQEILKILKQQQAPKQTEVQEEDFNIGDDDLAEGKHLKKVKNEINQVKKLINQYQQTTTQQNAETMLRTNYPDIDKVLSQQNLEEFSYTYPELAKTLDANNDLYSKAVSAYTLIKKLGIHDDKFEKDRERAKINSNKPRTLTSLSPQQGESPLSNANAFANGLTEDLKEQLRKEMFQYRNN